MNAFLAAIAAIILIGVIPSLFGSTEHLAYLATPLAEGGQTPFQMIQAFVIAAGAALTLWLAYKRTEAINSQAKTAQKQAEVAEQQMVLNQRNLERADSIHLQDKYQKALEMIANQDGGALSTIGGIRLLEEVVKAAPADFYGNAQHILLRIAYTLTKDECSQVKMAVTSQKTGEVVNEASWPEVSVSRADFLDAIDTFVRLRDFAPDPNNDAHCLFGIAIKTALFKGDNFSQMEIDGVFEKCTFTGCDMTGMRFKKSLFKNCKFKDCDMRGAELSGHSFGTCSLIDCRVDDATIDIDGYWTIQNNGHAPDAPPKSFPYQTRPYQSHIDEELALLQTKFAQAQERGFKEGEEAELSIQFKFRKEQVPALRVVD
ncbi:pentapeptide repeat-containing protein [Roseibium algae]|uniref:Pentapeptide repeat-containing protein n=1 Tax=Roseibium algae TaxID=3123038 RepID=A0ABU8TK07_9HYPH